MQKTMIKVYINCELCKRDVLKAVTKLEGVDQISVESEKDTVTVVGDVDPVMVVKQVRKTGKAAEIVSVGPSKPPVKKPDPPPPSPIPLLPCCNECELVGFGVGFSPYYYDGAGSCSIL